MSDITFYMKNLSAGENAVFRDLEQTFKNDESGSFMRYVKCSGLEDKGKPKNIYTESYADSDELRVYLPSINDGITRDATDITFTFYFIGPDRQAIYQDFYDFVKYGKIEYYDTKRLRLATMYLTEPVKPSEDTYKGSTLYIAADFKFKNIYGECFACNSYGIKQ